MTDEYHEWYAALGIRPGCTWTEARTAYRKLVKVWHPDRFSDSTTASIAQEKFKRVTKAYKGLATYYKAHGHLPDYSAKSLTTPDRKTVDSAGPVDTKSGRTTASASLSTNESPTDAPVPKSPDHRHEHYALAAVALLGLLILLTWETPKAPDSTDEPSTTALMLRPNDLAQVRIIAAKKSTRPDRYFTVGSLPGDVYDAQGIPTRTDGDIWYYNDAKVFFRNGRVSHWDHDPYTTLNAKPIAAYRPEEHGPFFTVGATATQVLEIQGRPDKRTHSEWNYGTSTVYFNQGKVVGWTDIPPGTLHIPPR